MDLDEPPDTAALFLSDESDDNCDATSTTAATAFASTKRPVKSEATQLKKVQRVSEPQKKKTRKNGKPSVSKAKTVFATEKLAPEQRKKLDSVLNKLHTRRLRLVHGM